MEMRKRFSTSTRATAMNITFYLICTSAALALASVACIDGTAFAQEGQQYNCAPGTVLRYDECEPVAASVPASRSQMQTQQRHATAPAAHATAARMSHPQAAPPKLARHIKPPPSGSLAKPQR